MLNGFQKLQTTINTMDFNCVEETEALHEELINELDLLATRYTKVDEVDNIYMYALLLQLELDDCEYRDAVERTKLFLKESYKELEEEW